MMAYRETHLLFRPKVCPDSVYGITSRTAWKGNVVDPRRCRWERSHLKLVSITTRRTTHPSTNRSSLHPISCTSHNRPNSVLTSSHNYFLLYNPLHQIPGLFRYLILRVWDLKVVIHSFHGRSCGFQNCGTHFHCCVELPYSFPRNSLPITHRIGASSIWVYE